MPHYLDSQRATSAIVFHTFMLLNTIIAAVIKSVTIQYGDFSHFSTFKWINVCVDTGLIEALHVSYEGYKMSLNRN